MNNYVNIENAVITECSSKDTIAKDTISKITENTKNTWQNDRTDEVKKKNTSQGKKAELVFERYAKDNLPDILYISYDDLRCDEEKLHAPCDGFIIRQSEKNEKVIKDLKTYIALDTKKSTDTSVRLSKETKNFLMENQIYVVEIKSTKINTKKKNKVNLINYKHSDKVKALIKEIRNSDDFLTYPHLFRSVDDFDVIDYTERYIEYMVSEKIISETLTKDGKLSAFAEFEKRNALPDIYIRIYTDEDKDVAVLMGYIDKNEFFDKDLIAKRMPQPGKSEHALYLTKKLTNGHPVSEINNIKPFA